MRIYRFYSSSCQLLLIGCFVLLTACSNNVKDTTVEEYEPKEDAVLNNELLTESVTDSEENPASSPMWVVGDEWFQRDYIVRLLQELSMNDAIVDTKLAELSSSRSQAPLSIYEGNNYLIQISSIDNPSMLSTHLRELGNFITKASTKPRDMKSVYGYNYQFLLLMLETPQQGTSTLVANSEGPQVSKPLAKEGQKQYSPSRLLSQLREVITEHGDFPYAMQLLYDHDGKMLGILGATNKDYFNYMQALLLHEIHTNKDRSLLDVSLAMPLWLAEDLNNHNSRILRIEYIPKN